MSHLVLSIILALLLKKIKKKKRIDTILVHYSITSAVDCSHTQDLLSWRLSTILITEQGWRVSGDSEGQSLFGLCDRPPDVLPHVCHQDALECKWNMTPLNFALTSHFSVSK